MKLEEYQSLKMGINVIMPKPKVEILIESESDRDQTIEGINALNGHATARLSVVSCHRNFDSLPEIVKERLALADIVIAGAGKVAALPGIIKSALCAKGHSDIPVIGVAFEGKTAEDNQAAIFSIKYLPEQPVELDLNGEVYFGRYGFSDACRAAIKHEFLPKTIGVKPVQMDIKVHN